MELAPALREYIRTKLARVIRYFDEIIEMAMILGLEKLPEKD